METPKKTIDGLMYDGAKVLAALSLAGFRVVPKEATTEMLMAPGEPYYGKLDIEIGLNARREAWRKMLDAAP